MKEKMREYKEKEEAQELTKKIARTKLGKKKYCDDTRNG